MNDPLLIGDFRLRFVGGGRLRIDGGNMFGVVPRVMWERESLPDEQHRISLATNCILVQTPDSLGLIDTGYGSKAPPKFRQRHALENGAPLVANLADLGIQPADLDWVILTHLHFDHAGGASYRDADNQLQPTFHRARHFIQRIEWDDATGNVPELAGAYYPEDFSPLADANLVQLVEGDVELLPGIRTQVTNGHTRGHQLIYIESHGESAVCLADLCPTAAHLKSFWTMAYDQYPLTVRKIKPIVMNEIVDRNRIALFSHDPHIAAARLTRKNKNEWIATNLAAV